MDNLTVLAVVGHLSIISFLLAGHHQSQEDPERDAGIGHGRRESQAGDATSMILGSNPGIDENFHLLFLPTIQNTNTDTKV